MKIKSISMMQPYAWLFSRNFLTIDDRAWCTRHRGPTAIHASKRFHQEYYDFIVKRLQCQLPRPEDFESGGVVGIANLVDCLSPAEQAINGIEKTLTAQNIVRSHFGAPGFHGFVFDEAKVVDFFKTPGKPGIFEIADFEPVSLVLCVDGYPAHHDLKP